MPATVGRLAPSPTGLLHLGHARSFLLAWWSVRAQDGSMLLRMEDLDESRVKEGMADQVLRDLEWLGLDWDGAVTWQSERGELYDAALLELHEAGLLYPCVCTRKEIELAQSAPHASDATRAYPGTCEGRFESLAEAEESSERPAALRLRVPPGAIPFEDLIAGPQSFDIAAEEGDFPVAKRDGAPAYQLAVVVDDAAQGVTEILRGDDLLPSTARQALLQSALDLPRPIWIHVPLVTDATGRRLAKRSDDLSLAALRDAGTDPARIVEWVAASAGMAPTAPLTATEAIPLFDLERLPRTPTPIALDAPLELPQNPPSAPPPEGR